MRRGGGRPNIWSRPAASHVSTMYFQTRIGLVKVGGRPESEMFVALSADAVAQLRPRKRMVR